MGGGDIVPRVEVETLAPGHRNCARVTGAALDLGEMLAAIRHPGNGAIVSFVGVVRVHARGRKVLRLEYHAYEPMAARVIKDAVREAETRWNVRAAVAHRVGSLEIGEVSVAIVIGGEHRAEAFAACRHLIDRIKAEAPIWKKEHYENGEEWIEGGPGSDYNQTPGIL